MINIDKIRATVPLSSVLPEAATEGACPFCHAGRFRLSVERGLYACPDCGEKGDVIIATMKFGGVDFRSAIARLKERGEGNAA